MSTHDVEFNAKRIVRPRNVKSPRFYPIIALQDKEAITEDGETFSLDTLLGILPVSVPSIVATQSSAAFLVCVTELYGSNPSFQWKCSSREREIVLPSQDEESEVTVCQLDTIVHFFGWRDEKRKNHRYHLCLDPVVFYGRSLSDLGYKDPNGLAKLLQWAVQVRDWCNDNQISVRPTSGGIGSQFLRNRRFYPNDRRKVPSATNARVREVLPGNYYKLHNELYDSAREFTGTYIDQTRAHHYHARNIRLPNANSLYAYGDFSGLTRCCYGPKDLGDNFSGLKFGDLRNDNRTVRGFWYSCEESYLADKGTTPTGIIAAWGSTDADDGLAKYAKWAESELDRHGNARWLKPILLSPYGLLAARPREPAFGFHSSASGTPCVFAAGSKQLVGSMCKGSRKIEPTFANVLHRGLIEAATRCESLGLAEWLTNLGFTVLSIYADAVIIDADTDHKLPILPEPWRVKDTLHHLRFINSQAFVSGEMTKLPGSIGRTEALAASRGTVGPSPSKPMYEALTGRKLQSWELPSRKRQHHLTSSLRQSEKTSHSD